MDTNTLITLAAAIIPSVLVSAINYGIQSTKITVLERDLDTLLNELDAIKKEYVSMMHFQAVVGPMQVQMTDMQKDIKTILFMLHEQGRKN